jgi:hypothetical protein
VLDPSCTQLARHRWRNVISPSSSWLLAEGSGAQQKVSRLASDHRHSTPYVDKISSARQGFNNLRR